VFLGIVATYSFANGILYWDTSLLLILTAHLEGGKTKSRYVSPWLFISVVIICSYIYEYHKPPHHTSVWVFLEKPMEAAKYVCCYLGFPIVHFDIRFAFVAGVFGILIFVLSSILICKEWTDLSALSPYMALGFYSIGTALMTCIGRVGFGYGQSSAPRYVTISNLLWISNIVFLTVFLLRLKRKHLFYQRGQPIKRSLLAAVIAMVAFLAVTRSVFGIKGFRYWHDRLSPARSELFILKNEEVLERICSDVGVMKELVPVLKKYRLSVFRGDCGQ